MAACAIVMLRCRTVQWPARPRGQATTGGCSGRPRHGGCAAAGWRRGSNPGGSPAPHRRAPAVAGRAARRRGARHPADEHRGDGPAIRLRGSQHHRQSQRGGLLGLGRQRRPRRGKDAGDPGDAVRRRDPPDCESGPTGRGRAPVPPTSTCAATCGCCCSARSIHTCCCGRATSSSLSALPASRCLRSGGSGRAP